MVARVDDTTWAGESDDEDGQLEGGSGRKESEFEEHGYNSWEVGFSSSGIRYNLKDEVGYSN